MNLTKTILISALLLAYFITAQGQVVNKKQDTGYGSATYSGLTDNEFMKTWMVLGPINIKDTASNPDEAVQKAVFDKDLLTSVIVKQGKELPKIKVDNTEYSWKMVKSDDGIVDFTKLYGPIDYSVAYALAEVKMENSAKILVGVSSDDGIKLFLNGLLVHSNWIGRGVNPDDDLLYLDLKKGSNQILIKIQDMQYDWAFCIRKLGKDILNQVLLKSSGAGNIENVKLLVENGADINSISNMGLTAYQFASIKGRDKVMDFLKGKGAKTDIPMPSFDKFVDQIFKSAQTGTMPGVSVLVTQNGKTIYEKSFGYADVGNKVPVSSETKFRIGSITKQFVAAAILKLQEEGKINITDKLSKFIPEFPRGDEVTIHHLLTHTSGIHSYTNRPYFLKYLTMPISSASLIDTIKAYPYDFNPGEKYQYNNSGFAILGFIVEKISGKSLNDYLAETFFKPLGMINTGIYEATKLLENEAYGYSVENENVSKAINWDMSWAGGAGSIYSTVKDLYLWNEAVFRGKVLSDSSIKAAFTPVELSNKQKIDYGYGWGFTNNRGIKTIGHTGGVHGFLSVLERQPETNTTVTILCNSTPPPDGISPGENSSQIMEYLFWQKMDKQTSFDADIKVDEKLLKSYLGKYDYGQGAILTVTLEGDQLFAQLTGQPKFPIFPASNDLFMWKVVEASIKFVTNDKGVVTHAIHNQGGLKIEAKKLE